jgi:hypothetical protein
MTPPLSATAMSRPSSARYASRRGLTLLEVVAATALTATLLSAMLVAVGRHTLQVRRAQDRIAALEFADDFLRDWLVDGVALDASEGFVAGKEGWRWRLSGRPELELEPIGAHLGRVEVIDATDRVLAQLEFVSTSPLTASRLAGDAL